MLDILIPANNIIPNSYGSIIGFSAHGKQFHIHCWEANMVLVGQYRFEDDEVNLEKIKRVARLHWIGGLDIYPLNGNMQPCVRFYYHFDKDHHSPKRVAEMAEIISLKIDTMIADYYNN